MNGGCVELLVNRHAWLLNNVDCASRWYKTVRYFFKLRQPDC